MDSQFPRACGLTSPPVDDSFDPVWEPAGGVERRLAVRKLEVGVSINKARCHDRVFKVNKLLPMLPRRPLPKGVEAPPLDVEPGMLNRWTDNRKEPTGFQPEVTPPMGCRRD